MIYDFATWGYFSALALIACVPISVYVFGRQLPARASMFVLLHANMWLPQNAAFDFPMVPPLDKSSISMLTVFVLALFKYPKRVRAARFGSGIDVLSAGLLLGTLGTVLSNGDIQSRGAITLPAITPYDGFSFALRDFLSVAVPVLAGRVFIRSTKDLENALNVMVMAGLIYTIPILYELRMSPMLHVNLYGFAGHDSFVQNVRDGGYRAAVFMGHGLGVSFFMCLCTLAAITLYASGTKQKLLGPKLLLVTLFLFVVLVLNKSSASLIYALVGIVVIGFLSIPTQMRIIVVLATIVIAFPVLRITDVFPTEGLVELSTDYLGVDRAQSLAFRFDNEDQLVQNTRDRSAFGWGGYGRERSYDPKTGKNLTVEDGVWIIVYATRGFAGFFSYFLLHLAPVFYLALRMNRIPNRADRSLLAGLAFIITLCCVNMLPNGEMKNVPLFLAGGLWVLTHDLSSKRARTMRPRRARPAAPDAEPPIAPRDGASSNPA